ncbi:ubiquitin carboxyl-terminal hydrolase isozyme L5 [Brachionus plicatilis]|uniref:Ubiquitin carboxyl-terminal hydrolase n=1 Tax=Brachionus plicatilis TaxID=10195 RepID=A0A3M7R2T8_BRAPC|nr:ubiquitin carboxyl-terminal hydrolase isozyme L5 [Brachionus plicatilis]
MAGAGNWCLIESDPGVFTELIRGFGVKGVQVEELYSLDPESFSHLKPIHGLIFLFKWIGNSGIDGTYVKDSRLDEIVFVKQVIENACATQALISVLLNCNHEDIDLGTNLTEFKQFVSNFDPDTKGLALSNSEVIRQVHNSFARQQLFEIEEKAPSKEEDAFHFIAYLPIKGKLYELDGLKEAPIDLGEIPTGVDWTDKVRPILEKRMMKYSEGEIHFNLMALVSDRKMLYERELKLLTQISSMESDEMTFRIRELESLIEDEERKRVAYRKENARRKHNYLPFIIELLKVLAEQGKLSTQIQAISERQRAKKPRLNK